MTTCIPRNLAATLLVLAVAAPAARAGDEAKEAAAQAAAAAWLARVDEGRYAESWAEASELFRGSVSKEQWVQVAGATRKPLGAVVERKLRSRTYSTTLPGAPDGEYVVIQYQTSFANKKASVETVTPMREKDGRWRVSGYFIR